MGEQIEKIERNLHKDKKRPSVHNSGMLNIGSLLEQVNVGSDLVLNTNYQSG